MPDQILLQPIQRRLAAMAQLKRDKLKGSDVSSETAQNRHRRRMQPGAQDTGAAAKAITRSGDVDAGKLKKNRRARLGVGPDHKTPLMRKRRRGSFP